MEREKEQRSVILVVDDEEGIRSSRKEFLEENGFDVFTAENGHEALEIIEKRGIDLVMTDYQMAGMNSLEFVKIARQVSPATRILLMTGTNYLLPDSEVKTLGLDGYIEKPFTPTQILDMVDHVLSK